MTFSQVYAVVRGIPRGMVASYGDVAIMAAAPTVPTPSVSPCVVAMTRPSPATVW
jgi:alkylated DNA nucleotide flippase Atl1